MRRIEQNNTFTEQETFSRRINYIVFDLDGVLIDTMHFWKRILANQVGPEHVDYFIKTLGTSTRDQVDAYWDTMFPGRPKIEIMEVQGEQVILNEVHLMADVMDRMFAESEGFAFPEVPDMLDLLKYRGYNLSISSSHPEEVIWRKLREDNLSDFFDHVVGKEKDPSKPKITKGKPHFTMLAKAYGIPYNSFVEQTLFIDDGATNIEKAAKTGVFTVGKVGTISEDKLLNAGAIYTVHNVQELFQVVENIEVFF